MKVKVIVCISSILLSTLSSTCYGKDYKIEKVQVAEPTMSNRAVYEITPFVVKDKSDGSGTISVLGDGRKYTKARIEGLINQLDSKIAECEEEKALYQSYLTDIQALEK